MDTVQLGGVTTTTRKTRAVLQKNARLVVRERMYDKWRRVCPHRFCGAAGGEGSAADLVSRSVARGNSGRSSPPPSRATRPVRSHSGCDAILAENGTVLDAAGPGGKPCGRGP